MQNNINSAMIFAAGLGTRMRPLTENTPKPLIKVNNTPLIDYTINMLSEAGIKNKIINSFYLSEQIENYFSSNKTVKIVKEPERLETGGGLKNALGFFNQKNIVTCNSDIIFEYKKNPVKNLIDNWDEKNSDILMLLTKKDNMVGYSGNGDFAIDKNGFLSKPDKKDYVYTGLQIINTSILQNFKNKVFSLPEVFNECLSNNRLKGILYGDKAFHVGDMEALEKTQKLMK